jgi:uronate dehydrogenase
MRAVAGADAVVHLAGVADEAPFATLLSGSVLVAQHVLEASRRAGVRRVVLASSNRLTGCYPISQEVSPDMPPRPDGLYGVSKVAIEALGRLYADKFGLEVVCVRIGSLEHKPFESRHLATWLSPRDCQGFFLDALISPQVGFRVMYAISANPRRFWAFTGGYEPVDAANGLPEDFFREEGPQGGGYATPEYTLRHLM